MQHMYTERHSRGKVNNIVGVFLFVCDESKFNVLHIVWSCEYDVDVMFSNLFCLLSSTGYGIDNITSTLNIPEFSNISKEGSN